MKLRHLRSISGKGGKPHQFAQRLSAIAVDNDDFLWAVGDSEVKRFTQGRDFVTRFSTDTPGRSIAISKDTIWVGMQGRVVQFDFKGKRIGLVEDTDRLGRVTGLAVDGDTLVVGDATHRAIQVYQKGRWKREIGHDINTRGFMLPNGLLDLSIDVTNQTIVVSHPQKHRVERYDFDGKLVGKFGRFGMSNPADFGGCCNPTNVATTPNGWVVVSEKAPARIKVYSAGGKLQTHSSHECLSPNTKNIRLAADKNNHLFATDPAQCQIEVFQWTME